MNHAILDKEIRAAITAHDDWNRRLSTAINLGDCETPPDVIATDNQCAFGKWLYSQDLDPSVTGGKPYQVVKRLHAEFHDCAARIARLANEGKKGEAYALMDNEYAQRSSKLIRALTKWRGELSV